LAGKTISEGRQNLSGETRSKISQNIFYWHKSVYFKKKDTFSD